MRLLLGLCFTMLLAGAQAANIGLVLPFEGRFEQSSKLIRDGVVDGLSQSGIDATLIEATNDCDVDAVPKLAKQLAAAQFVIGPLCFNAAKALAEALKTVPVIMLDSRSPLLERARTRDELPLYDLGKPHNAEAHAFLDLVIPRFEGRPFALLDDGSVHSRSLADAIRLLGEERGIAPIAVDTFRPFQTSQRTILRRLVKSGVEAVLIAGGPEDVETILGDMRKLNLGWKIAVGDQAALLPLMTKVDVPDGLILLRETLPNGLKTDASNKLLLTGKAAVQLGIQLGKNGETQAVSTALGDLSFDGSGIAQTFPYKAVTWGSLFPSQPEGE